MEYRKALLELPPRARRIHLYGQYLWWAKGTTSACAENTALFTILAVIWGNYLRVRGEYCIHSAHIIYSLGTTSACAENTVLGPPQPPRRGTTSACAENTPTRHRQCAYRRNYLRVRGEYLHGFIAQAYLSELPPRARRILHGVATPFPMPELPPRARRIQKPVEVGMVGRGTTSACAENTDR